MLEIGGDLELIRTTKEDTDLVHCFRRGIGAPLPVYQWRVVIKTHQGTAVAWKSRDGCDSRSS